MRDPDLDGTRPSVGTATAVHPDPTDRDDDRPSLEDDLVVADSRRPDDTEPVTAEVDVDPVAPAPDPVDADNVDTNLVDTNPVDTNPVDADNVDTETDTVDSDIVDTDAVDPDTSDPDIVDTDTVGAEAEGEDAVVGSPAVPVTTTATSGPLWAGPDSEALRERWRDIQLRFVDDPRTAADDAAALVDEAARTLIAAIEARRAELTHRPSAGGTDEPPAPEEPRPDGETEQLRVAVQRYRGFLDEVLKL